MSILYLRIVKIAVFIISSYIAARLALSILRRRNAGAAISDPEIIAIGVFSGFVITNLVMAMVRTIMNS